MDKAPEQRFNVKGFSGAVQLKQFALMPDGKQYIGISGKVSILSDEEMVGFKVSGGESNWIARIDGEQGSVNVLGCQVRLVHQFDAPNLPSTFAEINTAFYQVP